MAPTAFFLLLCAVFWFLFLCMKIVTVYFHGCSFFLEFFRILYMYGVQLEHYEDFLVAFSVWKVIYPHKEVFFKFHSCATITYQTHIVTTARVSAKSG